MTSRDEIVRVVAPDGSWRVITRPVAVEAPVAIEVNGVGYAVMMATPADLTEFATGFLLTERLVDAAADIVDLDVFKGEAGWIVRATVAEHCAARIADRVRHRSSDTGCGLCGISGLEQVRRPVAAPAPAPSARAPAVFAALAAIRAFQPLNRETGAVHAAAWCGDDGAVLHAFEDVGRHNALDKLIGAIASGFRSPPTPIGADTGSGFVLVTSRVSFEMVDKALVARAPLLIGISAPTTMAIDHARAHGLTLIALARSDAVLVLNDPWGAFAAVAEDSYNLDSPLKTFKA